MNHAHNAQLRSNLVARNISPHHEHKSPLICAAGALLLARKIELVDRVQTFAVGDLVKCGDIGYGIVEYFGPHAVSLTVSACGEHDVAKG